MQPITTKPATAAEAILAIDLGKYKSVACLYGAADEVRFLPVTHQSGRAPRLFGAACGLQPRNEKSGADPRARSTGSERETLQDRAEESSRFRGARA